MAKLENMCTGKALSWNSNSGGDITGWKRTEIICKLLSLSARLGIVRRGLTFKEEGTISAYHH